MRSFEFTFTTHDPDRLWPRTLVVRARFDPGCRGARDSLGGKRGAGPPLEPDEPDSIEILSVEREGKAIDFESMREELEDRAFEELEPAFEKDDYDNR